MDRRDDHIVAAFAYVLQKRRRALGISQEELADRAGLSTSYVSLLETRKRQPTLSVMAAMARELGMSLTSLSKEVEDRGGK